MHSAAILLAALHALASANSDPRDIPAGLPRIVGGGKFMANLKARNILAESLRSVVKERDQVEAEAEAHIQPRFTETCGVGVGNCDAGYCCSPSGYCGQTTDYCAAPDCQFQYGPACDANKEPAGTSTSGIARPHVGNIPYGGLNTGGIQDCIEAGVISFTFDDGPYLYTKDLLDLLDSYGAKATFFITGNNLGKGEIDDCNTGYPQLIKRMYNSGHQIASHTWSHQNLSALTTAQFQTQIYYNEMAFRNILGVIPTYMRPPYSSCNTACSDQLNSMGYHVTYFDLDTQGYLHDDPNLIQISKDIFTNSIKGVDPASNDFLLIEHDIHYQVVYNLTKFILDTMKTTGWGTPVTIGDCLNDPKVNWYRPAGAAIATCAAGTYTGVVPTLSSTPKAPSTSATSTSAAATATGSSTSKTISTYGSCGETITCQGSAFGNCCSPYGYCGSTSNYCGVGCQSAFGSCASSSSSNALAAFVNGSCGGSGGRTCLGSGFGNCCSQHGWCGSTVNYCGTGCQSGFGTCS